jgi:hypothetical protein
VCLLLYAILWLGAPRGVHAAPPKLPIAAPETVGMNPEALAAIDGEVEREIAAKRLPGPSS